VLGTSSARRNHSRQKIAAIVFSVQLFTPIGQSKTKKLFGTRPSCPIASIMIVRIRAAQESPRSRGRRDLTRSGRPIPGLRVSAEIHIDT
jgi:hypothetical protein